MKNQVDDMKAATDHLTAEKVTLQINSLIITCWLFFSFVLKKKKIFEFNLQSAAELLIINT